MQPVDIRDLAICWHPYMVQMQPGELPICALQGLEGNQLTASFSDDELKKAYRQAVRRSHPDAPGGALAQLLS